MKEIAAIVVFLVVTGAFFGGIEVIEKRIRGALTKRRLDKLEERLAKQKESDK